MIFIKFIFIKFIFIKLKLYYYKNEKYNLTIMEILKQTKLTRAEWDSIEVPVQENEKEIKAILGK
jgi:endonuclease I